MFGQRDDEAVCKYARKCKRQKQLESQVAETTATNKTLQGKLDTAAELFPIIAKPLGLERTRKSDWTEYRAIVLQKLATDPPIKGAGLKAFRQTQDQAAATMQNAVASLQDNAVNVAFFGRPDTTGNAILPNFNIALRFNSLAWEWDETLQRMMAIKTNRSLGRENFKLAYQVMMQNGSMHSYEVDSSGNGGEVLNDPLFTRGFTIDKPDADHIFEGVSRGVPFDLTDVGPGGSWVQLDAQCNLFYFLLCLDRAEVNYSVVGYIIRLIQTSTVPMSILPNLEPCWLHGWSLVTLAPQVGHNIVTKSHSLACYTRNQRDAAGLRDHIFETCLRKLEVFALTKLQWGNLNNENLSKYILFAQPPQSGPSPLFGSRLWGASDVQCIPA